MRYIYDFGTAPHTGKYQTYSSPSVVPASPSLNFNESIPFYQNPFYIILHICCEVTYCS